MAKLITPTLLNSYDWLMNCPPAYKTKAMHDIHNTLKRVEWEPTTAIREGIAFEDTVYKICSKNSKEQIDGLDASEHFKRVCNICLGGIFQKKSKSYLTVDGIEYCLYGKIDVYFDDLIIDIKTTSNYRADKYTEGWQPVIYCYNESIKDFLFSVVQWKTDYSIKEIHEIWMDLPDRKILEERITDKIRTFMLFVEKHKPLKDAYHTIYCKS